MTEEFQGKEIKYPKIMKLMRNYYAEGLLKLYFVIEKELEKRK